MPPLTSRDQARLGEAVEALRPRTQLVVDEISRRILERLHDPDAAGGGVALDPVRRATLVTTTSLLDALTDGPAPDRMHPPDGALNLLRHVAPEQTTLPVVLRALRAGGAAFDQVWIEHLATFADDRAQLDRLVRHSLDHVARYVDRVSEVFVERWGEMATSASQRDPRRDAAVRALLAGEEVDAVLLAHPVDGPQLVVAVRPPAGGSAEGMLRSAVEAAGEAPMLDLALADGTAIAWLALKDVAAATPRVLAAASEGAGWAVVARAQPGLPGLAAGAANAREALGALRRIHPDGAAATHDELVVLATLLADEDRALRLVHTVLGPLAMPSPRNTDLCDTLRAYFAAGERKSGAAALLDVHEKTVAHRLRRIEAILGASIASQRVALESALLLQRAVIQPGARRPPKRPLSR